MPCSQVKIKGADENTHVWRIILNQTFFYFLLEICLPLKPKYQAISLKCFSFFLFFFILRLTFLFRSSLYRQDRFAVLYLCI